jgi:hypothetical protein
MYILSKKKYHVRSGGEYGQSGVVNNEIIHEKHIPVVSLRKLNEMAKSKNHPMGL